MNDDDVLRRALHQPTEPVSSYRALQDLRPTMRRARNRRRAGIGAAAAILLAGAGAGALALTSSTPPTVRTTPASDENGAAETTLPTLPQPREESEREPVVPVVAPTTAAVPAVSTTSEPELDEQAEVEEAAPTTRPPAGAPAPTMPRTTESPQPVAPPPTAPAPSSQLLTSACGDVLVTIDGRTVRIASITPLPGYTPQVATDGPESVEMTFRGADGTCEVHAELKAGGLDVEIQGSDDD